MADCVDKAEFELALVNLAVNARDAMPRGGRLLISAENISLKPGDVRDGLVGDFVALTVNDTGWEFPAASLTECLNRFSRRKPLLEGRG